MSRAEDRVRGREIQRQADMLGLPPHRIATWMASEDAEAARESRKREAARAAAVERAQDAAYAHAAACRDAGLPEGTSMNEYVMTMHPGRGDDVTRDPRAPYGSAANPAFLVDQGGVPVDVGYRAQQARQARPGAERSLADVQAGVIVSEFRRMEADPFMEREVLAFHARRSARAREAEASRTRQTGTGWPGEISRPA